MSAETKGEPAIEAFDSSEHATKLGEFIKEQVPGVSFTVFCDPEEIAAIRGRSAPGGQVLIRLVPPPGKSPDVFAAWVRCPAEPSA